MPPIMLFFSRHYAANYALKFAKMGKCVLIGVLAVALGDGAAVLEKSLRNTIYANLCRFRVIMPASPRTM